ncbi:MAG: hypothetical protein AAFQ51_14835 [Pseudomonadota bacterium]
MMKAPFKIQISHFADDESGATTVDWVVLCGAIVAIGIAATTAITTSLSESATTLETTVSNGVSFKMNERLNAPDTGEE